MKRPATVVRFQASEILALAALAATERLDELWLVRNRVCLFQTPDVQLVAKPMAVEGDEEIAVDYKDNSRVEVIDLHNHVIRSLQLMTQVDENTYVEAHFTEEDEFCLVLCRGLRNLTEAKPMRWMANLGMRRLF